MPASSPGSVFRFLERQQGRDIVERTYLQSLGLLLSDPWGTENYRALFGTSDAARPWLESIAPRISEAFPPSVTLLYADDETRMWTYSVWSAGALTETKETVLPLPSPLGRFLGTATTASADAALWATRRHLPVGRVPSLLGSRQRPPILDYRPLEQLDQRGLLNEDTSRLYRFPF